MPGEGPRRLLSIKEVWGSRRFWGSRRALRLQVDLDGAARRREGDDEAHGGGDVVRRQQLAGSSLTCGGEQSGPGRDQSGRDQAHLDAVIPDVEEGGVRQSCQPVLAGDIRSV